MLSSSTAREILGTLLVSIALVACGDGDSLPEPRNADRGTPAKTFSAPLPSEDPVAVVDDSRGATDDATGETAAPSEPVESPTIVHDEYKAE